MKYFVLLLMGATMVTAQTAPNIEQLRAQYDALQRQIEHAPNLPEMERLMDLQQPVRQELMAYDMARFAADTQLFLKMDPYFRDMNVALAVLAKQARQEQHYRREPWRKEFWRFGRGE